MAKKKETKYYSYDEILSKTDINGNKPSIYMISSNRSAGKTFSGLKLFLEDFKNKGRMFCLLYRTRDELSGADTIFTDVLRTYPKLGTEMTSKSTSNGLFYTLILDGVNCGFAISIRQPDKIKKYSGAFSDVYNIMFDEFQLESGEYIKNEDERLYSVLMTIARGGGEQSRYVRCFLLGNNVSMINPYFLRFGIHDRLMDNTRFIRGDGFIAEFNHNKSAEQAIKDNAITRAFGGNISDYTTGDKQFLKDNYTFVEKMGKKGKYYGTIVYDGDYYGTYNVDGLIYITKNFNLSDNRVYCFRSEDMENGLGASRGVFMLKIFREVYINGNMRFESLQIKKMMEKILSIAF